MKTKKFKNNKFTKFKSFDKKYRIILIIATSIFLIYLIITKLSNVISYDMKNYLKERVKKENTLVLKNGFSYLKKEEVDLNNLITVIKNSKDEIIEVQFNIKECTLILSHITSYINENLNDYNFLGYRLDIPIGIISNNILFRNFGPKIPIKVEIGDIAMGDVHTTVKSFGINSALIELSLSVTLNTSILYPFDSSSDTSTYTALIASKIITGKVPSFYNGSINSKSDAISLPITEEM